MMVMKKNKEVYYDIYSEFNNVNKYRELKSILHHGNNRLDHINRVAKLSFMISKTLKLDYVSCTRGAMMHDFFTLDDLSKNNISYHSFLKQHPRIALENSEECFKVNDIEKDIILTHMFPVVKGKPHYKESKVVCISDKLISVYEFLRYELKLEVNVLLMFLMLK